MILAAGLGTRLRPLTDNIPKALITIRNRPVLEWVVLRLIHFGFDEIIVNVHHHAKMIKQFLNDRNNFGIRMAVSEETELLDTGGGLKKASWFFNDDAPFILHNVDVLTDLDLKTLYQYHKDQDALASLAVRDRKTKRYLIFDPEYNLCGWKSLNTGETRLMRNCQERLSLSFMGIHILSPEIIPLLDKQPVFSIIKTYLNLVTKNYSIKGFRADSVRWLDLGRKENLSKVDEYFDPSYFKTIKIKKQI
jgi:NDP-sugar pyrophosphorylase family protein